MWGIQSGSRLGPHFLVPRALNHQLPTSVHQRTPHLSIKATSTSSRTDLPPTLLRYDGPDSFFKRHRRPRGVDKSRSFATWQVSSQNCTFPARVARTSSPQPSLGDEEPTIKVASKKDTKNGTIKLKKPPPKHNKPGNWRDASILEGKATSDADQTSPAHENPTNLTLPSRR